MKISAIEGERQMAKLKFDGLSSLPSIAHFLNNAFREWLDKTMDELAELKALVGGYNELLAKMKDRSDHLNRRAGERDAKIGANTRHMEALRVTSQGEDNRIKARLDKLEKCKCKCKCNDEKPKKPKKEKAAKPKK